MTTALQNKQWYRVYKSFSSGSNETYLLLNVSNDEYYIKEECVNWAENSNGGTNNGYHLEWDKVDAPPEEWLIKKIELLHMKAFFIEGEIDIMSSYLPEKWFCTSCMKWVDPFINFDNMKACPICGDTELRYDDTNK